MCLFGFSIGLLLFMMVIGYKVYKVIKKQSGKKIQSSDRIVLIMILLLNLDAISLATFDFLNAIEVSNDMS